MNKTRFILRSDLYKPNCVLHDWDSFRCHLLVFQRKSFHLFLAPIACLCFSLKEAPTFFFWHWVLAAFSFCSTFSDEGRHSALLLVEMRVLSVLTSTGCMGIFSTAVWKLLDVNNVLCGSLVIILYFPYSTTSSPVLLELTLLVGMEP